MYNKTYMMREVCVHDDNKISGAIIQTVDVSGAVQSLASSIGAYVDTHTRVQVFQL